jgi:hypothetical protein
LKGIAIKRIVGSKISENDRPETVPPVDLLSSIVPVIRIITPRNDTSKLKISRRDSRSRYRKYAATEIISGAVLVISETKTSGKYLMARYAQYQLKDPCTIRVISGGNLSRGIESHMISLVLEFISTSITAPENIERITSNCVVEISGFRM